MADGIKSIALLGATGSIGTQTLDVIRTTLPYVRVKALSGYSNIEELARLVIEFSPEMVCVADDTAALQLRELLRLLINRFIPKEQRRLCRICFPAGGNEIAEQFPSIEQSKTQAETAFRPKSTMFNPSNTEILIGETGLKICAAECGADILVNALVGRVGLLPTLAAIESGKHVALANKETLVTAGSLVMNLAREKGVRITPIDSEHSAIWQCLQGNAMNEIEKIILTASGGPFRTWEKSKITAAKAKDALRHPNWSMGAKITIDSATLMNKGLELIEAMWLFDMLPEQIETMVHPQSIIHSMVQFADGSLMAQMGLPDMRLPILYALTAPNRVQTDYPRLDLLTAGTLSFEAIDTEKFPCMRLARYAAKIGGTLPAVMNYVNEWAVGQYLKDKIEFYKIPALIDRAFDEYTVKDITSAQDIINAETWAHEFINK